MSMDELPVLSLPTTSVSTHYTPSKEESGYQSMYNGKVTNKLVKTKTSDYKEAQIEQLKLVNFNGRLEIDQGDYKVFINQYRELTHGLATTAKILLDTFVVVLTEQSESRKSADIEIPLKEYMSIRGFRDVKRTREQVTRDLEALHKLHLEISIEDNKSNWMKYHVSGGKYGIEKGIIKFRFSIEFFNLLRRYPIMPIHPETWQVNQNNNPNGYYFARHIQEHKNMNYHHPNADIVSVKKLLESSPDMPKYDELGEAGQLRKRIIDPFERDMSIFSFFTWHYCGPKGSDIEQPDTYEKFINANVKITFKDYPERPKSKSIEAPKRRTSKKKGE